MIVFLSPVKPAFARENSENLFNYSFAIWLGSGIYRISDADTNFAVLRLPLSYTLKEAQTEGQDMEEKIGFRLLVPMVFGFQTETGTNVHFGAAAIVPGIEILIPINQSWILKPFAHLGIGKDTYGGDLQFIAGGGIKSLYTFSWKKYEFGVGNSILIAGNSNEDSHGTNAFSMLEAGFDVNRPTKITFLNQEVDLGCFIVASRLFNRAEFFKRNQEPKKVGMIYTLGLTLGFDTPLPVWKFDLERVGIEYRWGDAGFQGISFNMGFPF